MLKRELFQHVKIASTLIETPAEYLTGRIDDLRVFKIWLRFTAIQSIFRIIAMLAYKFTGCEWLSNALYICEPGIYVYQLPYKAEFDGDIDLKYTERVQMLYATDDFTLVKKINGSDECGYVSTRCLKASKSLWNFRNWYF